MGQATSGGDVLAGVAETGAEVVLIDAGTAGLDGLEMLDQLRTRNPEVKVVMLSAAEDSAAAAGALRRNAPRGEADSRAQSDPAGTRNIRASGRRLLEQADRPAAFA